MCGIVGIVGFGPANQQIYDALTVLQHRGQDAAGIMTEHDGALYLRKDVGLVRDVFQQRHMVQLKGSIGIGHVRYPTAGCDSSAEAQPFYVNAPYGICLAHNGNLTNATELADVLVREDRRHLNTTSDSEVLLNVLASELQRFGTPRASAADIFAALSATYRRIVGGYAVIAMILGHGIVGFRDPHGIRPLVLGKRDTPRGREYMLASESVALDQGGFELLRDVGPGEAVYIDETGRMHTHQCAEAVRHTPCIFEYVYFARPDSIIDNISVYKARMRMGELLAEKIRRVRPNHDIDVVIPIPDTSRTSAMQVAQILGVKYREGFIKNRYIGRTFIMPGQDQRKKSVRSKLNAIDLEFRGKNVLLVDDSIVRGTTSAQIIEIAREAGANKVYFASAAPPVRYPNVYGIDMPATSELVAAGRSDEEVAKLIGADWLIYQDLDDLVRAVRHHDSGVSEFDTSCFSGEYVAGDITRDYLDRLQSERSDLAKQTRSGTSAGQGILKAVVRRVFGSPALAGEVARSAGEGRDRHPTAVTSPRDLLLACFSAALRAVDARSCVRDSLRKKPLDGRWHVLGAGKAAAAMALGARDALGVSIVDACVVVPKEHTPKDFPLAASHWQRIEAAHPMPDASSLAAGEAVLEHIARLPPDARVLCLVSGGASSLLEAPRAGITLADVRAVNRWALTSGAPITTINAVRRRLSRVKGGGLAAALGDRRVVALMISDVPGDDPSVLGSGLLHSPSTATTTSSPSAARRRTLDLRSLPPEVQEIVRRAGPLPRFGPLRRSIATRMVGTSGIACRAAAQAATARGYAAVVARGRFSGSAAELGSRFAANAAQLPRRTVYVQGGESTVSLPVRPGRGGRNQHLALSAALSLDMQGVRDAWLLAAGTDGIDGATDDAGALVDGTTCERGRDAGYDPRVSLAAADSGTFLEASGDLVHTGATLTNVGDVVLTMRWE